MRTGPWPTCWSWSDEVRAALAGRRPVVALESTIITHGMPYPQNLDTARGVESVVREGGAVPATIAVLDGRLRVGLDPTDLDLLATRRGGDVVKASRRDLAAVLAGGATAGTTVATTMMAAHAAGIAVFATGGIGGVHRGAEQTFDVSADLLEFARTPVAVVCAGAKSILDIGKTLEVLETHGVPVLGYQTDDFPAFYARTSGHRVDRRVDTPEAIAAIVAMGRRLGLPAGVVVANPDPRGRRARRRRDGRTHRGGDRRCRGRRGRAQGPDAVPAAAALRVDGRPQPYRQHRPRAQQRRARRRHRRGAGRRVTADPRAASRHVLVVGDVMRDIVVRPAGPLRRGTDQSASIRAMPGGAGANQAAWLAHLGMPVRLFACVGAVDLAAEARRLRALGVEPALVGHPDRPTGTLLAMIDTDGERSFLTDRGANDGLTPADVTDALFEGVAWVHVSAYAFVGSPTAEAAGAVIEGARGRGLPVSVDAGSSGYLAEGDAAARLLAAVDGAALFVANRDEAAALTGLSGRDEQAAALATRFALVLLKDGAAGALAWSRAGDHWHAAAPAVPVVDTIGAGDAFLAGFLAARLRGEDIPVALRHAVALGAVAVGRAGGAPPG